MISRSRQRLLAWLLETRSVCGPSLFKSYKVQVPLGMTHKPTSAQPRVRGELARPPHRDFIIRKLDRLVEVTVAPPGANKPGMWPPPSCTQYGLQEVPNLVSDDILAGLNFVLGNQALEWGEAHTSAGLSPGFGESFVPSFRSKRRSVTGAEQMFTE